MLVTGRDLSSHILRAAPHEGGYVESGLRRSSMAFLAPAALTISHGDAWDRRRAFNERVLDPAATADAPAAWLPAIESAFNAPFDSVEDVRGRMREVMLNLVVGEQAPASLTNDIDHLIGLVNSPVRRAIRGRFSRGRRDRFYSTLRRQRSLATMPSLLARSRDVADSGEAALTEEEAIEQVPHWMFPFAGSATDLLMRTLAMIGSRPDVWQRIEEELAAGTAAGSARLEHRGFLNACILETGRLFPPVTRTFHTTPQGDVAAGVAIPAGIEVIHFFPLMQRDPALGADAGVFRPERWLDGASERLPTSNLFLSGSRECPGRELILFVLRAAIATHVTSHQRHVFARSLASDPVPFSYPSREVEFRAGRPALPSSDQATNMEAR